ncbi:type IX secretion system histidine kinase PorY [Sediminibacterium ginsengisoli]|uniref:histidine kinase n=1 Tax=Sediminibacterium ginsengisoli TaxID=413434 RepID=A0A1T4R1W5_9BACT|nr:ATP-binding protein [Sediminibacterium ginsengisoli]SKA10000.1 Signal transduction histidine kinase [Sediminibacterium ginsengisoli]
MKLLAKYNRVNIVTTILIFIAGSIAFYFVLYYVLTDQLDRGLRVEQQEIVNYVNKNNALPEIHSTKHQWMEFSQTNVAIKDPEPHYGQAYNILEQEKEVVRQLTFTTPVNGLLYRITVNQSVTESEDLLELIIMLTMGMIALVLISNYLVNRKVVNKLWEPFYATINNIRNHKLAAQEPLHLPSSHIEEIDLLNDSINKMTSRIHRDYINLRTFTENASHEMQTPLAVIRSKTENLLQDTEGQEKTMKQLLAIESAAMKLSRLHQSLLLLTKLENRQFQLNEEVNLEMMLREKLEEKETLIAARSLALQTYTTEVILSFHHHLAEILLNNLISNVIRYTPEYGNVTISLDQQSLSVSNTAAGDPLDNEKIFQRFYKAEQSSEGTGLGLSIVKEICALAGFRFSYKYDQGEHHFLINFS